MDLINVDSTLAAQNTRKKEQNLKEKVKDKLDEVLVLLRTKLNSKYEWLNFTKQSHSTPLHSTPGNWKFAYQIR